MSTESISREALYALVWAEPMLKVAPRFGLSDRGLAKICDARNIPVPPRGYWAKLAHGHKVKQTPLPPAAQGDNGLIHFHKAPKPANSQTTEVMRPEIEFERQPENEIVVPDRLTRAHPLVERTRGVLRDSRPSSWTRGLVWARDCLDVRVSPASVSRAMRILQALMMALEQRGHSISVSKTERRGIVVRMMGEEVVFRLVERTKQVRTGKDYPRYDLVPTGILVLEIGDWWSKAVITDGKTQKVEERLNDFVVKLLEEAFAAQQRRAEQARREAELHEQARVRAIEEAKRKEEERKIAQWDEWMANWRKAREVRAFARAIRRKLGRIEEGSKVAGWLAWAEDYATRIDPLREP